MGKFREYFDRVMNESKKPMSFKEFDTMIKKLVKTFGDKDKMSDKDKKSLDDLLQHLTKQYLDGQKE